MGFKVAQADTFISSLPSTRNYRDYFPIIYRDRSQIAIKA
jgi:hypothetical protein